MCSAIFIILEMNRPLEGMIKVSSAPMRKALEHLGQIGKRCSTAMTVAFRGANRPKLRCSIVGDLLNSKPSVNFVSEFADI